MFFYQRFNQYFAQVAGGLEDIAAAELKALGATDGEILTRGIHFKADRETLYRINYRSRLVTRVLAPLVKFEAKTPEELYLGAKKVDWTRIFTLDQTFAVFANTFHSEIDHSQYASLKVKDCVADMFRKRYRNKRPNVDPREPDLVIAVHIFEDQVTVSIDCSGGSLHRRGYRQESVEAPMQETLAAAIIDFAKWDCKRKLYDPMCGSGTLLSEAWLKAGYIPPGTLRKHFGFMMLPDYDRRIWVKVKFQEDNKVKIVRGGLIRGSDINAKAVRMTRKNNARIPGGDELIVKTMDFRDIESLEDRLIICNPPYGIRMKKDDDMGAFMKEFGDFLKQRCTGSDAFIYFGDRELVKSFGLKPAFKMPLRNGGLDGRLVKYELY
ncbi:MAG: class I SAM-dependent RNA methyltransferase [Candidatus Krumholzibacteria bacterium]|nr:class I SAM-dependent RNA methyltransferase [Candidatus Krumholzibacteria bacterium]